MTTFKKTALDCESCWRINCQKNSLELTYFSDLDLSLERRPFRMHSSPMFDPPSQTPTPQTPRSANAGVNRTCGIKQDQSISNFGLPTSSSTLTTQFGTLKRTFKPDEQSPMLPPNTFRVKICKYILFIKFHFKNFNLLYI